MLLLPDHGVGAVILTNSVGGYVLQDTFDRFLLEQLFDGKPEAEEDLRAGGDTIFDFKEWKSAVASRKNDDGTLSFVTMAPEIGFLSLIVGAGRDGTRQLILRFQGQHEYIFVEAK